MAASTYWKMLQMVGIWWLIVAMKSESQVIRPECSGECGNVTIPYPFGIEEGCALNEKFTIVCDDKVEGGPKPFLPGSNGATSLAITNISLDGTLQAYTYVQTECDNATTGEHTSNYSPSSAKLPRFYYSTTRNKFTVVGCHVGAVLDGYDYNKYGCSYECINKSSVTNGSCSGAGCCQASIPKQLSQFDVTVSSMYSGDCSPCSYIFIADIDYFNFSADNVDNMPEDVRTVLDWAVGDQSCMEAEKDETSYACKDPNSECQDSDNGPGYRCFCKSGYTGNPYIPGNCSTSMVSPVVPSFCAPMAQLRVRSILAVLFFLFF